jgi:hypothetical protein
MTQHDAVSESGRSGPYEGYGGRFERRPEFLFGYPVPMVVDASTVRERTVGDLKVFAIKHVFAGNDEIFVGFGKPNAYLVVPDGKGGYQKFAGKSLRRAPSVVEDTRGFVQSGILVRFRNLPPHAAEQLRRAMKKHHGIKYWTCVNANARVLEDAGFTSGRKSLSRYYWPYAFMRSLIEHGLYFEGQPVEFEVIRTTGERLERYAAQIIKAEALTFCRHADRSLEAKAAKSKVFKAALWVRHAPGRAWGSIFKKKQQKRVLGPVAPALPANEYHRDIRIRVSVTSGLGTLLRQIWDSHALFEGTQERVNVLDYQSEPLKPFPQENPNFVTRLKKRLLFSPFVVNRILGTLAPKYAEVGVLGKQDQVVGENDVYDMLRTHSDANPNIYNLVITSKRIIIARTTIKAKIIDWILSKHVLMSGYDKFVVFAGEIWKDEHGVIHVSRNSGTYQPKDWMLQAIVRFLQAVFPHLTVVAEERDAATA